MLTFLSFQWASTDRPQEDTLLSDEKNGISLVADGVTRTPGVAGYPNPSPAKLAADRLLYTTHDALLSLPKTPKSFHQAWRAGNEGVRQLNQKIGLWDHCDYREHDLAGAVCAGAWLHNHELLWAFLTDCGVATLSPTGAMLWETPDRLASVQQYFPNSPQLFISFALSFEPLVV